MSISLHPLTRADLEALAADRYESTQFVIADGALPPQHVLARALRFLAEGQPERWCTTFFVVVPERTVVGACGFKGAPAHRRVEVGYGISPAYQRHGHATAAVRALLAIALASAEVSEVLAQVGATNAASTRVVAKLGFTASGTAVDENNEHLVQWVAQNDA